MLTFLLLFVDMNNYAAFSGWWYVASVLTDIFVVGVGARR